MNPRGREKLRQAILARQPWRASTGPRTAAGKAQAARNGKRLQQSERSIREIRASLADLTGMMSDMAAGRRLVAELLVGQR